MICTSVKFIYSFVNNDSWSFTG
ncbi:hypothetical protein CY0110_16677 [Crocosphaera chwakensis CCY0110]|uniref:Uncharacterized protein n=1 Tax=Crocosphaera chwakensis CCY0110 TaxID=391612 RepID=A3II17_9CHRO|nr:hypothetical protein CY0110_16677 [Crocosphaera chwakensis CCY0110]